VTKTLTWLKQSFQNAIAPADWPFIIIIIIIMQRLTRHVSVIRMTNRRRGGHVDLRIAVIV